MNAARMVAYLTFSFTWIQELNTKTDKDIEADSNPVGDADASPQTKPGGLKRVGIKLLRIGIFTYAGILAALVLFETMLVYPGAYMSARPEWEESEESGFEFPTYESSDGVSVKGLLLHRGDDKPVVMFFHGNGEKAAWLGNELRRLSNHFDANVLAVEYRGFVSDTPKPSEAGVILDCKAARGYLMDRYKKNVDEIILYGRSLGGACAVALAADGGAKALVLDRTFDRMVDVAASLYWFMPVKLLMRNRYDSVARLESYRGPLIQVHGPPDRVVPIKHAKRLFESADCEPREFKTIPNLGHNDPMGESVLAEIATFVKAIDG